jgi:tetratricopeptide (TPR) repeat protein
VQQRDEALIAYEADSADLDLLIWLGRRTAYLQEYPEAIEIFSEGIKRFPKEARLYRHRGHRFISTRQFDKAIADFQKAANLIEGQPLQVEPDGLPNKLNVPLSNTQFNIYYHWALAHYLKGEFEQAADKFTQCLDYCNNDDLTVATIDWLYMSLRRDQKDSLANTYLQRIHPDMLIIENDSYYRRLLMYKGIIPADSLLQIGSQQDADAYSLALATQGYGVANWYYYEQQPEKAYELLNEVISTGNWSAFGYIAAEADLHQWP